MKFCVFCWILRKLYRVWLVVQVWTQCFSDPDWESLKKSSLLNARTESVCLRPPAELQDIHVHPQTLNHWSNITLLSDRIPDQTVCWGRGAAASSIITCSSRRRRRRDSSESAATDPSDQQDYYTVYTNTTWTKVCGQLNIVASGGPTSHKTYSVNKLLLISCWIKM